MKQIIVAALIFSTALFSCNGNKKLTSTSTDTDSLSYALGFIYGNDARGSQFSKDLKFDLMVSGLKDAYNNDSTFNINDAYKIIQDYPLKQGIEFLQENAKKTGVQTTASGLQFHVIKEGNGLSPRPQDTVEVHYVGKLLNGEEFDSSIKRGQTAKINLDRVIPGWTEGVGLMKEGGKSTLYVPSNLGYGPYPPQGSPIPPNSTLIFEIELIKVFPVMEENVKVEIK